MTIVEWINKKGIYEDPRVVKKKTMKGLIKVNGNPISPNYEVKHGDWVEIDEINFSLKAKSEK